MRPKKQPLKLAYGSSSRSTKYVEPEDADDMLSDLDDSGAPLAGAASDDEMTDNASETDSLNDLLPEGPVTEIKERMYLDKLSSLKTQLSQLKQGAHPEYNKRLRKLELLHKERIHVAEVWYQYERRLIETEYEQDRRRLKSDLEERRNELRDGLISELEDKRRLVELERTSMEISGDSMDMKPLPTRKLRRRPNDPAPAQERRRKPGVCPPSYQLDDALIDDDLAALNRTKPLTQPVKKSSFLPEPVATEGACVSWPAAASSASSSAFSDVRIEDNKLFFERKWFHRGQPVFVEFVGETSRYSAVITAIQADVVWVRNTTDNSKVRIYLAQLQRNRCSIKRRAS